MKRSKLILIFVLFFTSGFCSLLYQIIWLRKAFASFGAITPVVSLVISLFMLGLALGSWLGGKHVDVLAGRMRSSPIVLYGLVELLIGTGGILVPRFFLLGANYLLGIGESNSGQYLMGSAMVIAISILPWCLCMGATVPFAMAYVKRLEDYKSSFSYLYLANIFGAVTGILAAGVFLIELFGFSFALWLAAALNAAIACTSFLLGTAGRETLVNSQFRRDNSPEEEQRAVRPEAKDSFAVSILFITGFCSMAMEVVWTRAYTPITTTTIYAYILLLATYLIATGEGLLIYRRHLAALRVRSTDKLLGLLAITSCLPLLLTDPRLHPNKLSIILGLLPFCACLGYLTPSLIDQHSAGSPKIAGRMYAINATGCILGPLFVGYILLPIFGCKWSHALLTLPFMVLFLMRVGSASFNRSSRLVWIPSAFALMALVIFSHTYEDREANPGSLLLRDHTATVIAKGSGQSKALLVNGIPTTFMTPLTKVMAHLPLASLPHKPSSALIICFGMGTTYRSALSWDINVTAVELVPSVKKAFGYFVPNASELIDGKKGKVIIDDGRRYLQRTTEKYDVITLDPPPPVEASASSLLYSEEFYRIAKQRLKENGILQQWYPGGEEHITNAIVGALAKSFPYIRVYRPLRESGLESGLHFLASMEPIDALIPDTMLARMPAGARKDLMEWFPNMTTEQAVMHILSKQVNIAELSSSMNGLTITDDRPANEFFALRRNISALKSLFNIPQR